MEPTECPDFAPSSEWAGRRPGYAFKTGPKGVGYYRDSRQAVSAVPRQPAAATGPAASAEQQRASACAPSPAGVAGTAEVGKAQPQQQQQQQQQDNQGQGEDQQRPVAQQPSESEAAAADVSAPSAVGGGSGGSAAAGAVGRQPPVLQKANNPFLKLLKGKKLPAAAASGGDAKRAKKGAPQGQTSPQTSMQQRPRCPRAVPCAHGGIGFVKHRTHRLRGTACAASSSMRWRRRARPLRGVLRLTGPAALRAARLPPAPVARVCMPPCVLPRRV